MTSPVEVELRLIDNKIICTEASGFWITSSGPDVSSLSMAAARREVTGAYIKKGYKPDGRWDTSQDDWAIRRFRPREPS
jgi:hypothetical protein